MASANAMAEGSTEATTSSELGRTRPRPAHLRAGPLGGNPVVQELQEAFLRLTLITSVEHVWRRMLTEKERQASGGDAHKVFRAKGGIVAMWMRLREVSQSRAIIDLAYGVNLLDKSEYEWLDEEVSKYDPPTRPQRRKHRRQGRDSDPNVRIDRARRARKLVLVRGCGHYRVYWDGTWHKPAKEWARNPMIWELLWTAAKCARAGNRQMLWDQLSDWQHRGAITHRKSRLRAFLPADLYALFLHGDEPFSYKLELAWDEIALITLKAEDCPLEAECA